MGRGAGGPVISKSRIFALVFCPAAGALIFGLALVQQKNLELSAEQFEKLLKNQWEFAALLLEGDAEPAEYRRLFEKTGLRTTVVERDGRVVLEALAEAASETRLDREEIRSALLGVPALVRRHSRTTRAYTAYYARELPDGRVLRVAYQDGFYDAQRRALLSQAIWGLTVLVAAVALLALWASRRLGGTLAELSRAVSVAQDGGVDLPSFHNEALDRALYALSAAVRELKSSTARNAESNARLAYVLDHVSEGVVLFDGGRVAYQNQRTAEILGQAMPPAVGLATRPEMINVFAALAAGESPELRLGGRVVAVSRAEAASGRLTLLRDVTDQDKYSGYKSDLVGNLSHELKTPLSIIMAAAEVIVQDREMPPPAREKFLRSIHRNAQRLDRLLEDMIALHKLESGFDAAPEETDLQEALSEIQDLIEVRDKKVLYDFDSGRVGLHGAHLVSLLTNLITNAVKYSTGDAVEVAARKKDNALTIEVADEGPLIPESERERIFERFYSLSASRNRGRSGSGLGLAIVKHIARLYNGRVGVAANARGGNTFSVTLVSRAARAVSEASGL